MAELETLILPKGKIITKLVSKFLGMFNTVQIVSRAAKSAGKV